MVHSVFIDHWEVSPRRFIWFEFVVAIWPTQGCWFVLVSCFYHHRRRKRFLTVTALLLPSPGAPVRSVDLVLSVFQVRIAATMAAEKEKSGKMKTRRVVRNDRGCRSEGIMID